MLLVWKKFVFCYNIEMELKASGKNFPCLIPIFCKLMESLAFVKITIEVCVSIANFPTPPPPKAEINVCKLILSLFYPLFYCLFWDQTTWYQNLFKLFLIKNSRKFDNLTRISSKNGFDNIYLWLRQLFCHLSRYFILYFIYYLVRILYVV